MINHPEFLLILGPMKSGKSLELIGYFAPLKYTDIQYTLYHSQRNVRDKDIWTRNGMALEGKKIKSLNEVLKDNADIIGIDEIHMFSKEDAAAVEELLQKGKKLIISGLDTDYRGRMFPVIQKLLELGPTKVKYKKAICQQCKDVNAVYSRVSKNGKPIKGGLPSVLPDDGTYEYESICRNCFKNK